MAITFISAASGEGTGTASAGPHILTQPASLVTGNVVILIVSFNSAVTVTTEPTGFTPQRTITDTTLLTTLVYWKVVTTGEAAWEITFSGTTSIGHHAMQYSGVNPTGPLLIDSGKAETGTTTDHITSSIVLGGSTCWLISSCSIRDTVTSTFTSTTGTDVERLDHQGSGTDAISMGTYDSDAAVAPATISRTLTSSTSSSVATMWIGALYGTPDTEPVFGDTFGGPGTGVALATQPIFGGGDKPRTTGQIWPQ